MEEMFQSQLKKIKKKATLKNKEIEEGTNMKGVLLGRVGKNFRLNKYVERLRDFRELAFR